LGVQLIAGVEKLLTSFIASPKAVETLSSFAWVGGVEQNTAAICREYLQYAGHVPSIIQLSEEQQKIVAGNEWRSLFLYAYGQEITDNTAKFPQTCRALKAIPGMTTAFFSVLEPNTRLTAHRGPYRGVLRYHLGLIIPENYEQCGLHTQGAIYHWQYGKSLIFDDTFMHYAWNDSDQARVILFVDFKRNFPFPIRLLNNFMISLMRHSPFVQNIVKGIERTKQ
jgi:beta-hydroxylase